MVLQEEKACLPKVMVLFEVLLDSPGDCNT